MPRTAAACPSSSIKKQATPNVKEGRRMAATCHRWATISHVTPVSAWMARVTTLRGHFTQGSRIRSQTWCPAPISISFICFAHLAQRNDRMLLWNHRTVIKRYYCTSTKQTPNCLPVFGGPEGAPVAWSKAFSLGGIGISGVGQKKI
jgi:hypothetical protein